MSNEPSILRDAPFMDALFDLLIPPGDDGRMLGAGSLGLSGGLADALEADARWMGPVSAGLRALRDAARERDPGGLAALSPGARLEVLESQLERHPALVRGITTPLYLAYYQHPDTLERLGEPPRPPFPGGFDVEATNPTLLEQLRARARTQS
jgi:hypothetical protein